MATTASERVTVRELRTYVKARTRRVWSIIGHVSDVGAGRELIRRLLLDPRNAGKSLAVFVGRARQADPT